MARTLAARTAVDPELTLFGAGSRPTAPGGEGSSGLEPATAAAGEAAAPAVREPTGGWDGQRSDMRDPAQWDRRYVEGDLPWDTGRHDRHLEETLRTRGIPPGRVLEHCGDDMDRRNGHGEWLSCYCLGPLVVVASEAISHFVSA